MEVDVGMAGSVPRAARETPRGIRVVSQSFSPIRRRPVPDQAALIGISNPAARPGRGTCHGPAIRVRPYTAVWRRSHQPIGLTAARACYEILVGGPHRARRRILLPSSPTLRRPPSSGWVASSRPPTICCRGCDCSTPTDRSPSTPCSPTDHDPAGRVTAPTRARGGRCGRPDADVEQPPAYGKDPMTIRPPMTRRRPGQNPITDRPAPQPASPVTRVQGGPR